MSDEQQLEAPPVHRQRKRLGPEPAVIKCSVCAADKAPYKFRCCSARYCSVSCFGGHDSTACAQTSQQSAKPDSKGLQLCPIRLGDDEELLSDAQKAALGSDDKVRTWVKNSAIREAVLCVCSTPYESVRVRRLGALLKEPEFMRFANDIMTSIGENADFPTIAQSESQPMLIDPAINH
eukprot:GDKH01027872.1.p1 GENE.GDKH01027872.1~~GDKH01027872.1.p1  ORF type:complete len:179 (-),score=2.93 GDKH01027872.1:185-721(-)